MDLDKFLYWEYWKESLKKRYNGFFILGVILFTAGLSSINTLFSFDSFKINLIKGIIFIILGVFMINYNKNEN